MANPQAEDGHIDIANEIGEALCFINLSAYESRILWFIWRKTWGWHKKEDRISYTQFEVGTGLDRRHIQRSLKRLQSRLIIASTGYGTKLKWAFQKDYEKWDGFERERYLNRLRFKAGVAPTGYASLPKEATQALPKEATTKEKKETIKEKDDDISEYHNNNSAFLLKLPLELQMFLDKEGIELPEYAIQELVSIVEDDHKPLGAIKDAFRKATRYGAESWAYVKKILEA